MKFLSRPEPTERPGWWFTSDSLLNDRYRSLTCDHRVGRRKCRGAAARFYQADEQGRPLEAGRALCLVHFRKEIGA